MERNNNFPDINSISDEIERQLPLYEQDYFEDFLDANRLFEEPDEEEFIENSFFR